MSTFFLALRALCEGVVWEWVWHFLIFFLNAFLSILNNFKIGNSENNWFVTNSATAAGYCGVLRTGVHLCNWIQWIAQTLEVIPHNHPEVYIYWD